MFEISPSVGSAFFLRSEYLTLVDSEDLMAGKELSEQEAEDILNAAVIYSAEYAAMTYLARAEHCRAGLTQKLLKKGIKKFAIEKALDYLEQINYLNDERFAGAWLRSRSIDHAEGRIRLLSELLARGVNRVAAQNVLNEFFRDKDELEICRRAYKKTIITRTSPEKIKASLIQKGFTLKQIDIVLKENS